MPTTTAQVSATGAGTATAGAVRGRGGRGRVATSPNRAGPGRATVAGGAPERAVPASASTGAKPVSTWAKTTADPAAAPQRRLSSLSGAGWRGGVRGRPVALRHRVSPALPVRGRFGYRGGGWNL